MIEILGSQFETALRYMLLLYQIENLSASKICSLDYIATYAEDFKLASRNINGYNPYRFAEYTMRESLCTEALRSLVLKGIVDAQLSSEGLLSISIRF